MSTSPSGARSAGIREVDVTEVLRDYGRYFIGPDMADAFAQGLLALERNWRGPLLPNAGVDVTLAQFQDLERRASPQLKLNWRFQQALYRAYYDAYLRARLTDETARERRALELLANARSGNPLSADRGRRDRAHRRSATLAPARRCARASSNSPKRSSKASACSSASRAMPPSTPGRGANLDLIDRPITNADWLLKRFAAIRALESDAARRTAIDEILNWTNPGPGGFYDDLGDPANRPHLDPRRRLRQGSRPSSTPSAPASVRAATPRGASPGTAMPKPYTAIPFNCATPALDPSAHYKVRFTQSGDSTPRATRLVANGNIEIHPMRKKDPEVKPVEFDIPAEATAGGTLTLEWQANPEESGNGRFVQLAEVWLIRK